MVRIVKVLIGGIYAGALYWDDARQVASFEYAPAFKSKGWDLSPIQMPIARQSVYSFPELSKETFMGLPGLFADALPDSYGKALLDRWLASQGRTMANPLERLCYQGKRSMGALEFEPAEDTLLEQSSTVELEALVKVAAEILNNRNSFSTNLQEDSQKALIDIIKVGTSAGGMRAKAVIAYNENTGEVRSGQVDAPEGFDHWLLKLDGVNNAMLGDPQHYGKIEYVYYLLAREAGIDMMECRLKEEQGRSHFMTRRFDRIGGNKKLHTQTLCGIAHYDYKMPLAYSYEQAFQVMRALRLPYPDAEQMYRRMVFNVIARNQDDHTKNISFIMDTSGEWRLSPAYDMSWAYNPEGQWTARHQMSINNKWEHITRADLLTVASKMHIQSPEKIIEAIAEAVSSWQRLATEHDVPKESIEKIEQTLLYSSI